MDQMFCFLSAALAACVVHERRIRPPSIMTSKFLSCVDGKQQQQDPGTSCLTPKKIAKPKYCCSRGLYYFYECHFCIYEQVFLVHFSELEHNYGIKRSQHLFSCVYAQSFLYQYCECPYVRMGALDEKAAF